jgi:hypothetical protein
MMDREVTDYGAGTLLPGSATSMEKTMWLTNHVHSCPPAIMK